MNATKSWYLDCSSPESRELLRDIIEKKKYTPTVYSLSVFVKYKFIFLIIFSDLSLLCAPSHGDSDHRGGKTEVQSAEYLRETILTLHLSWVDRDKSPGYSEYWYLQMQNSRIYHHTLRRIGGERYQYLYRAPLLLFSELRREISLTCSLVHQGYSRLPWVDHCFVFRGVSDCQNSGIIYPP